MIRRISPGAPGSGQPPVFFTTKVGQAATAVTELEAFVAGQQVVITGAAADKDREEEELETAAHRLGCILAVWFREQNDEISAASNSAGPTPSSRTWPRPLSLSSRLKKLDTDRRRHIHHIARRLEFAGLLIDPKDDDRVGVLIFGE